MKLQVGLSAPNPAWQLFLDQERVAVTVLESGASWNPKETPVVILTTAANLPLDLIRDFLNRGGRLAGEVTTAAALGSLASPDVFFTVDAGVTRHAGAWQSCDKYFNRDSAFPVLEITAVESKRKTREAVRQALRRAFWSLGLPYGHLAYYPLGYRSVFSFRFDFDEYDPDDFAELCRLLAAYRGSVTCFPCMKTYEPHLEELRKAVDTGVEFGSHAYVHHVYASQIQNEANLTRAEELLRHFFPRITAFSGPHGTWHPSLQRVLEKHHYDYSSEFSLDYDNVPFFPLLDGGPSSVLQIPAHPVCEGVFLQAYPYREEILRDYYDRVISQRAAAGLPILLFGHPTRRIGRYPAILHNIYRAVERSSGIWKTEFRTYAAWWRMRHQFLFTARRDERRGLQLEAVPGAPDTLAGAGKLAFQLDHADGRVEHLLFGRDAPSPVCVTAPQEPADLEAGVPVLYPPLKKLKRRVKRFLDWETKTPLPLLRITDAATALKWALRALCDKIGGKQTTGSSMERKSACASAQS